MFVFSLQAPQKAQAAGSNTVNFQARLQTAAGAIVPDDTYNVQFKLYSGSSCAPATGSGCTQEWTESYQNNASNGVQVINGYLTVNLGSVTAFPTTLDWDQPLYLSMNIGGTTTGTPTYDGEMKPYLKLTAVPYAFQAKSASQLQQLQGSYTGTVEFTTLTDNRTISLPDAGGTVCLQNSADCGFLDETTADGRYLQNSATIQTGNINLQAATSGSVAATFQANASGTGDILDLLDGNGTNVLSVSNAGDIILKPSDTSLTGFQIQNSSKTIFDVDTINGRVGINGTDPSYALDVNGDINSTTAVRVGGVAVCTVSNCVPTSGSNNYVQNTTGTQDGANINIRSVADNAVTAVLQGASGQTADILQVEGWDGTSTTQLMNVSSTGNLTAAGTIQAPTVNATTGYSYNGTTGTTGTCTSGQFLQNQVVQGGIVTGGTCAAAGTVTGTGTANTIALFSGSGSNLGNSILTQSGTTISAAGTITATTLRSGQLDTVGAGDLLTIGGGYAGTISLDASDLEIGASGGMNNFNASANQFFGTLTVSKTPTASATSSLVQIGSSAIQGGNANGTYLGLNAASGYAGDLMNFQVNGASKFLVNASGNVNAGQITVNGGGTWTTISDTGIDYTDTGGTFTISGAAPVILNGSSFGVASFGQDGLDVQNASNKIVLGVSSTGTITLGDSTSGNYITVSSTGLTAYGGARHTRTILLPAEYAGGTLDAASDNSCSSANSGIMASGFDNGSRQNYYEWVSNTGSTQCYDVVVQVPVPSDFGGWAAPPTLYVANSSSSGSAVCVEAITTSGSIDSNYGGYSCTTTGSSLSSATLPTLNGSYAADGYMTFKIRLSSTGNTNITKIGNLTLQYYSKY